MKKTALKKFISMLLILALLMTMQVSTFASSAIKHNTYIRVIDGVTYYITDEYDVDGIRHLTCQSNERTITGIYDGKTVEIVSPEGLYTFTLSQYELQEAKAAIADNKDLQPMKAQACLSDYIMAFGFSGSTYSYSKYANGSITLSAGLANKYGVSNTYSIRFCGELETMARIYFSLNDLQKSAWIILRAYNLFGSVPAPVDVILTILSLAGIDLGDLLASTILGLNNWYNAEKRANEYFDSYA